MNHVIKLLFPWAVILAIFLFSFYLTSQKNTSITINQANLTNNKSSLIQIDEQNLALKQKLIEDFEDAFLKQYTPLLGCEAIHNAQKDQKCAQHLEHEKNLFKQEFIKSRGLPKNTFEEIKLSSLN